MHTFDSMNPYQSLAVISADSPQELVDMIKAIKTPVKIVAIVPLGSRHVAYVMGDVRVVKTSIKKSKGDMNDGNGNSK